MSEYTLSYVSCCLPDYFGGHHLPTVQVEVNGETTLGRLKDELMSYYAYAHIEEDSTFVGGFDHALYKEAVERMFYRKKLEELAFPELEVPEEDDDYEGCYAYFVVDCEYADYETTQVTIPVDEYIIEASLDWVRHNNEWCLKDINHFSSFLKGMEDPEHRMWILPAGLKQKAISVIQTMKEELKTHLEAETYGETK